MCEAHKKIVEVHCEKQEKSSEKTKTLQTLFVKVFSGFQEKVHFEKN